MDLHRTCSREHFVPFFHESSEIILANMRLAIARDEEARVNNHES
jgi:hypothetical protein